MHRCRRPTPIPAGDGARIGPSLETAALGHNIEVFARELERMLAISRAQARRLIDDDSGEPIVVAAMALRMPAAVLQRILLCLNPQIGQSVQRVYELALLHEEIEPRSALRLIAIWQASHPAADSAAEPPMHQPHHAADQGRHGRARRSGRKSAGTSTRRPAEASLRQLRRRRTSRG